MGKHLDAITKHLPDFMEFVGHYGAIHDQGEGSPEGITCPGDDTCDCYGKPMNDACNAVCVALHNIHQEVAELQADRDRLAAIVGEIADTADNLLHAAMLPVSHAIHVQGLKGGMEKIKAIANPPGLNGDDYTRRTVQPGGEVKGNNEEVRE